MNILSSILTLKMFIHNIITIAPPTFSSSPNALASRGVELKFADCSKESFHSKVAHCENAISKKNEVLTTVHYGES